MKIDYRVAINARQEHVKNVARYQVKLGSHGGRRYGIFYFHISTYPTAVSFSGARESCMSHLISMIRNNDDCRCCDSDWGKINLTRWNMFHKTYRVSAEVNGKLAEIVPTYLAVFPFHRVKANRIVEQSTSVWTLNAAT